MEVCRGDAAWIWQLPLLLSERPKRVASSSRSRAAFEIPAGSTDKSELWSDSHLGGVFFPLFTRLQLNIYLCQWQLIKVSSNRNWSLTSDKPTLLIKGLVYPTVFRVHLCCNVSSVGSHNFPLNMYTKCFYPCIYSWPFKICFPCWLLWMMQSLTEVGQASVFVLGWEQANRQHSSMASDLVSAFRFLLWLPWFMNL